jgi:23S rRNA (adenine2503-C2)-methyltransferase
MEELREGLIFALSQRSLRTTMIEVALIQDVNDSLQEADELADFCRVIIEQVPGCKLIVNLIPFNDIGQIGHYRKPSIERVCRFQKRLQEKGIYTHVRATRGDDESAACGQLATARMKANAHKDIRR